MKCVISYFCNGLFINNQTGLNENINLIIEKKIFPHCDFMKLGSARECLEEVRKLINLLQTNDYSVKPSENYIIFLFCSFLDYPCTAISSAYYAQQQDSKISNKLIDKIDTFDFPGQQIQDWSLKI